MIGRNMNDTVVKIEDVTFAYNGQRVLENVSMAVRPSDFIAMIGPNGGGKTTLLKLILGLLKPNRGFDPGFGRFIGKSIPRHRLRTPGCSHKPSFSHFRHGCRDDGKA